MRDGVALTEARRAKERDYFELLLPCWVFMEVVVPMVLLQGHMRSSVDHRFVDLSG